MDQLVSVKRAATLLECSEAAIRKWIYQGRLPVIKVGRLTRVRQRDLEAVVAGGLRARPGTGQQSDEEPEPTRVSA